MLRAENLTKTYGTKVKTVAVDGVSYTFEPGRCYAIVGPSGSGKTTLLYLLSAIETPDSGTVYFGDMDLFAMGEDERARFRARHFGFVFQHFYLIPYLNALENVAVRFYLKGDKVDWGKARQALERLGIYEIKKPYEYSGGQQQRIAIARAIVTDPDVLFADEPTGNLDSKNSRMVFDILREIASEGKTVIVATHDIELAGTCDTIIRLKDGKIASP